MTALIAQIFVRKKEPWAKFLPKALLVLGIVLGLGFSFMSRYTFRFDPQVIRCIPEYTMYLVDKGVTDTQRGKLYAFNSKDLSPIYTENTRMLKYLMAIPGDEVEITPDEKILVNGKEVASGLKHAEEKLGQPISAFVGKTVLGANQYWFLGTSSESFDSRYWGSVTKDKIVGRAYGLF